MQAQLAVRRLQEQATQDRITKANVLQMNEELKVLPCAFDVDRHYSFDDHFLMVFAWYAHRNN